MSGNAGATTAAVTGTGAEGGGVPTVTGQFPQSLIKRHFDVTLGKMLQPESKNTGDECLPYLRAANIMWGHVVTDDIKKMWFSRTDKHKYTLKKGDMVVLEGGDVGRSSIVRKCDGFLGFQNSVHRVRAKSGNSIRFALYWMHHLKSYGYFDLVCSKATLAHFTAEKFAVTPFPRLEYNTQKTIADFLDRETARIDQLIEKKKRLVELLKESEFAHITHKFSQLDARTWRVRHLGKLRNGAGFPVELQGDPSQDIAFFKVKHLKVHGLDAVLTETDDTVSEQTARSLRATIFPKGTIVFAKIGAALLLGRFSMLGRAACVDNNMAVFNPNEKLIEPHFALLGLSQADMTTMVQPGAIPSLSTEAFYNFGIPLPSKETQRNFVNEFRSWRAVTIQIIEKTQRSIGLLGEFRSALITAAVTGQIDMASWTSDRCLEKHEKATQT